MANKTFIGEEIFEFKPMRGLENLLPAGGGPTDPSLESGGPIDPSPAGGGPTGGPTGGPIDPSPTGGGPTGGPEQPEEPVEQPEDDETPEKSNTLTFLAIGLIAFFLLRKK